MSGTARGAITHHHISPIAIRETVEATRAAWCARDERAWLGLIAAPLAMTASALVELWWMWPVLLAVARGFLPSWRWSWVLSLELGLVGGVWGFVGASYLAEYPHDRTIVAAVWIAFALALAGTGMVNRMRYQPGERNDVA